VMESEQCQREGISPFYQAEVGEGCQVSGVLRVNKVAGNFHVAHGESIIRDGRHIHQFNPADAPFYNISHSIHSLSFGDTYPNMPANPLDGGNFYQDIIYFTKIANTNLLSMLLNINIYISRLISSDPYCPAGSWHGIISVLHSHHPYRVHGQVRTRHQVSVHQRVHCQREVPAVLRGHWRGWWLCSGTGKQSSSSSIITTVDLYMTFS